MSQVEVLRQLAAASAVDIAGIDAHLAAIVEIVEAVERRWHRRAGEGGDLRLQMKVFGSLHMRFPGELARIVVRRLDHMLKAEHAPFTPKVSPQTDLRTIGQHDLAVVEAHCTEFEKQEIRRFG